METLQFLIGGLLTALSPQNLMFAFIGCALGTLIGVLPGIGPAAGTALLIPVTFQLPATGAIIMLAAIYYGAMYGGTITSVLINVPGETTSIVTCFDGYQMARQGRAGAALSIAAIGSFIGGTLGTVGLVLFAPVLARLALRFGAPEFFALLLLGLSMIVGLTGASWTKGLMMGLLGLLVGTIGMDPAQGVPRFSFGLPNLVGGVEIVPMVVGLFGVADIFESAETTFKPVLESRMSSLIPTGQDLRDSAWPMTRGTLIGFCLGLIPGVQPSLSTFASYVVEKRMSKHPERFGTGMIAGVAGPETANNAFTSAALIPLFTLGIPTTATMAVLMGAFMINGLTPGPTLFKEHPDFVWAVIASLLIGNVILLILNLPLVGIWVQILKIPYAILFALILLFTFAGSYSMNNSAFDVGVMVAFGVLGYILKKLEYPLAPIVLGLILGPMLEKALRTTMQLSGGHLSILFTRPIAATFMGLAMLVLLSPLLRLLPAGRLVRR